MTGHLAPGVLDTLHGPARDAAVRHLRHCAPCRARVASQDPVALFALLATEPLPESVLDAAVPGARDLARNDASPARTLPRWAAIAASLLLAAVLGFAVLRSGPDPSRVAAVTPAAASETPRARLSVVSSPGVPQVVDLTVGATQVVMIFDSRMSL